MTLHFPRPTPAGIPAACLAACLAAAVWAPSARGQWTSQFAHVNVAADFNGFETLVPNSALISNGVWQHYAVVTNTPQFQFKFAASNFPPGATWGEDDQAAFTAPIQAVGEKPGAANIVVTNTGETTYRFILDEQTDVYRVDDVSLSPPADEPWINEFDYNSVGADTSEWVEIAGRAGVSLDDYQVRMINQAGNVRNTFSLTDAGFTFSDEGDGFGYFVIGIVQGSLGTADYTPASWVSDEIQNGPADSIQLRRISDGTSIHLLDYGGDNPHTAEDQQVVGTDNNTTFGRTVYLTGTGDGFADLSWTASQPGTPGALNVGQTLVAPSSVPASLDFADLGTVPAAPASSDTVQVQVDITARNGASNIAATTFYRPGPSGPFLPLAMTPTGATYTSTAIPAQPAGTVVEYYIFTVFDGVGTNSPTLFPAGAPGSPATYGIPANPPGSVWINEVNPDALLGPDTGEFVELAGPAGSTLTGWTIQLFTSATNPAAEYVIGATGLPNDTNGFGFFVLADSAVTDVDQAFNPPDTDNHLAANGAIALLNEFGNFEYGVVYGEFPPTNAFPTYDFIGFEDFFAFDDEVLALIGTGGAYGDFTWATNIVHTPGAANISQLFAGGNTNDLPPVIECPTNLTVACAGLVPAADTNAVTASGLCGDLSVTVTHVGDVDNGGTGCLGDPLVITRTYRAVSDCSTTAECQQIITVEDDVPPVLVSCGVPILADPGFELPTVTNWIVTAAGPGEFIKSSDDPRTGGFSGRFDTSLGGTGGPGPDSVTNLLLWLDANAPATLTESDGRISAWADKSGNGFGMSQADNSARPSVVQNAVNGLNALNFDGFNDYLGRSDALGLTGAPGITTFVMMRSFNASQRFFHLGENTGAAGQVIDFAGDTSWRFNNGNTLFGNDPLIGSFALATFRMGANSQYSTARFWKNGVEAIRTSTGGTGPPNLENESTTVGAGLLPGTSREFFSGQIAELAVYDSELSDGDRAQVEAYFLERYGGGGGGGPDPGTWNVVQDLAAAPGETWTMQLYARHDSTLPLTDSDTAGANLVFLNASSNAIATISGGTIDAGAATDTYIELFAQNVAPAGTAFARIEMIFDKSGPAHSLVDFDDPILSPFYLESTGSLSCGAAAPDVTGRITATDNCGSPSVVQVPAAGQILPLGESSVDIIARDCGGLAVTCSVPFLVTDAAAPTITLCPGTQEVAQGQAPGCDASAGVPALTPLVEAVDGCTASNLLVITQDPAEGLPFTNSIAVTITVRDLAGNSSSCTVDVEVVDMDAPLVTCPASISGTSMGDIPSVDVNSVTTVDCSAVNVIHVDDVDNGGTGAMGDPLVITRTYRAIDARGNSAECEQIITIESTGAGGDPPAVVIVRFDADVVRIVSEGTNTWSVVPEYATNINAGESGWMAVPGPTNSYANGTNTTTFANPDPTAPFLHFRIKQTDP